MYLTISEAMDMFSNVRLNRYADPFYEGKTYGARYNNYVIQITVDNLINHKVTSFMFDTIINACHIKEIIIKHRVEDRIMMYEYMEGNTKWPSI